MSVVFMKQRIKNSTVLSEELKNKLMSLNTYPDELVEYLNIVFQNEDSLLDQMVNSFNAIIMKYIHYLEILDRQKESEVIKLIETKLQTI